MSTASQPIVVYHIAQTRSERIVWLLEELGVAYELRRLSYRNGDLRSAQFLAVNPFGMVPAVIVDGLRLRESGAIFEYLLDKYPSALTVGREEGGYADYLIWLHCVEATVFQPVVGFIINTEVLPEAERIPEVARRSGATWQDFLKIIDEALAGRDFLCGARFTAADILMGHALRMADSAAMITEPYRNTRRYFTRLQERPAYQRMLAA